MTIDPDDLREALTIYHRETFLPDMQRMFGGFEKRLFSLADRFGAGAETRLTLRAGGFAAGAEKRATSLAGGFGAHFAEMHRRFDRLDSLSQEALAITRRIDERLDRVDTKLDSIETKLD